jgi:drug/metabolite transporter (DMT)-like permease
LNAPTSTSKQLTILPFILIALSGFVLSGMDATAKYLVLSGVPVLLVVWARYLFQTGATFIVLSLRMRSLRFLVAKKPGLQFIRAASLFGATIMFYTSLKYISLADATSMILLTPVIVTALSGLLLDEQVGMHRWIAVIIAFIGVMIVVRPGSGIFGLTSLLPLAAAMLTSSYFILTRVLADKDSSSATAFYSTAVGAIALSFVVKFIWVPLDATDWSLMLLSGALGATGHALIVLAYKATDASALAPFGYTQLLAAILWGYLVLGDLPSIWTLVGATLIVTAGLYVWYHEQAKAQL